MKESWDDMEARHLRERTEKMREVSMEAYRFGCERAPTDEALKAVVKMAAEKHGVTVTQILSAQRRRPVARARNEAFHMAREAGFPTTRIGKYFGRDHTTVIYGSQRHREANQGAIQ